MPVRTNPNRNAMKIVRTELSAQMHTIGKSVEQTAKNSMRDGGTPHVPSSPGEPPRIDTKKLHDSITTETQQDGNHSIQTRVGTNVDYGRYLELGTRKILPRPWLRPALNAVARRSR